MRLDRPREDIEVELLERARETWGAERVDALRRQIREAAGWIEVVGKHKLEIYDDEPDYLVAPERQEGR
jgi:hypothetical protein